MGAEYVVGCIGLCRATVAGFYLVYWRVGTWGANGDRRCPTGVVSALSRDFACTAALRNAHRDRQPAASGAMVGCCRRSSPRGDHHRTSAKRSEQSKAKPDRAGPGEASRTAGEALDGSRSTAKTPERRAPPGD